MNDSSQKTNAIQIKICGITNLDDALFCIKSGADALGFVFHPPSSRFVLPETVGEIVRHLPDTFCPVGVFVNETFDNIIKIVKTTGLKAVQLHGTEEAELILKLKSQGVWVIKALFAGKSPSVKDALKYPADAILVESPGKSAWGGTGDAWDWGIARNVPGNSPLILAGGLNPENIETAVEMAKPDAVDVSSGVELKPGVKDYEKVRRFVEKVRGFNPRQSLKKPFLTGNQEANTIPRRSGL